MLGEAFCHAEGIRTQLLRKRISIYNQTKTLIDYGSKQNRNHKLKHWHMYRVYLSYCTLVHFVDFNYIHFIHFLSAKVNQVWCNETSSIKSTRTLTDIGAPHVILKIYKIYPYTIYYWKQEIDSILDFTWHPHPLTFRVSRL